MPRKRTFSQDMKLNPFSLVMILASVVSIDGFRAKLRKLIHKRLQYHEHQIHPSHAQKMTPLHLSPIDDVSIRLYDSQLWFSNFIENNLSVASPSSFALLFIGGLLTAFSPCVLGLLPLTLSYLGIEESNTKSIDSDSYDGNVRLAKVISYSLGLSAMFCSFGFSAAFLGQTFNPSSYIGSVLGLVTSVVIIAMGLNLLELINIQFPDLSNIFQGPSSQENDGRKSLMSITAESFVFGLSSALVSSPCTSPVLASLIAFVATSSKPLLGAGFLLSYSMGYVTPVIAAGVLSGSIKNFFMSRQDTSWVNSIFASVLITFGTYKLLENMTVLVT
jgi:cytochrome c-type biogenesis protein